MHGIDCLTVRLKKQKYSHKNKKNGNYFLLEALVLMSLSSGQFHDVENSDILNLLTNSVIE